MMEKISNNSPYTGPIENTTTNRKEKCDQNIISPDTQDDYLSEQ